jgi:hypothetical protein
MGAKEKERAQMIRAAICAIAAAAYLVWVATYLAPYTRAEVFSDANLRRVFHTAIHY